MSKDYTFTHDSRVTVGEATKKSEIDKAATNTDELDQRMEAVCFVGSLLPDNGGVTVGYDSSNRISTIEYTTSPLGTITITYDSSNRVSQAQGVFTDPVAVTITEVYSYDSNNRLTGITRTVT